MLAGPRWSPGVLPGSERIRAMIRAQGRFDPAPAIVLGEIHLHDGAVTTEGDALNPHRQPGRQLAAPVGHDGEGPHRHAKHGQIADDRSTIHHSTIWSARSSSDCGIVRPSAFAVFTGS